MSIANKCIVICTTIAILLPWITNVLKQPSELTKLRHYFDCEFKVTIPIRLRFNNEQFILPDLIEAAQIQIDEELRYLGVRHLDLVIVDELQSGNVSEGYMMDLILHHENSLGISSDSLQVAIFYTLESIHANDLPFFLAQTVLYHFLNGEVELFKRSECEDFMEHLRFEIGFGNAVNKATEMEVLRSIERLFNDVFLITRLQWVIKDDLVTGGDDDIVINFPGERSKTIKSDKSSAFKIRAVLEEQLRLPSRPGNNLQVRLFASYRKKALTNLNRIFNELYERGANDKIISQVAQLITEMRNSRDPSWLNYLETTQNILTQLDTTTPW
ncbi:hypothetical protein I9W82_003957 [Candida metapsilosis]|uniref:Uncharacterized protein n=1 Tax=Candida metapsilosis TaxID=273372 RepID=A0A8H8DA65_9ASCO|nr:hypothetical protein I9W82_003957 [Candida metapsilosis]